MVTLDFLQHEALVRDQQPVRLISSQRLAVERPDHVLIESCIVNEHFGNHA